MGTVFIFCSLFLSIACKAQIVSDTSYTKSGELYTVQNFNDSTIFTKLVVDSSITRFKIYRLRNEIWEVRSTRVVKNGITVNTSEFIKDGSGVLQQFTDDGLLQSIIEVKNGKMDGVYTTFFLSGAIKESGVKRENLNVGEWVEYFENGSIRSIENYILVPFEDQDYAKYTHEEIMEIQTTTNGKASLKHGIFIVYNEDGTILSQQEYINGKLKK